MRVCQILVENDTNLFRFKQIYHVPMNFLYIYRAYKIKKSLTFLRITHIISILPYTCIKSSQVQIHYNLTITKNKFLITVINFYLFDCSFVLMNFNMKFYSSVEEN
jgi:hypothetical protein